MKSKVEMRGGKEFEELLSQLPPAVARRVSANALRAGGRIVRDDAKLRVPVKTGELKKALKVRTVRKTQSPNHRTVRVGVLGKEGPLAHLIEFGTSPHVIAPKRKKVLADPVTGQVFGVKVAHPGNPPQPYLRPAFDTKKGEVIKAIGKVLGEGIDKEAGKLAEKGRLATRRR